MTSHTTLTAALLCSCLSLPSLAVPLSAASLLEASSTKVPESSQWLARGGGGGGRAGGGGGRSFGGGAGGGRGFEGGAGRGAGRVNTGFAGAGSGLNRGSDRPAGGWSSRVQSDRAMPSLNRGASGSGSNGRLGDRTGALNRDGGLNSNRVGSLTGSRDVTRNVNRDVNRNVTRNVSRNWGRNVNLASVNLYPGWARPGWAVARPWSYGWYGGWATPAWGWWGARAAAWGISTLATAAVINNAVNNAVDDHVSYIAVPDSDYQLQYGTIAPQGNSGVTFVVTVDGSSYQLSADCSAGTLDGRDPNTAAEAQLLNAACQVAYGSA